MQDSNPRLQGLHILVVEDEKYDREVLVDLLEALGAEVSSAASYCGAKSLLERHHFHAIVTDQFLGDGEGLHLRGFSGDAAVILLTGKGSEELAAHAISRGVVRYLPKSESGQYLSSIGPVVAEAVGEQRVRTLQAAREDALRKQNIQLQRQVESMAHTLRAPIEASHAAAAGLLGLSQVQKDPLSNRYVQLIKQGTGRAIHYLDSTRTFAMLRAEEAAPVELDQVLKNCLQELATPIAERRVTLEVEELPRVLGAGPQLETAFEQLIKNVLRHTPPESHAWVRATPCGVGMTRVTIEDDGPGVEASRLLEATAPFITYDMKPDRGPGLGLAIVRRIVGYHGGELTLSARAEGGLCVALTLPLAH